MKKLFLLTLLGTLFTLNLHSQTKVDSEIKDFLYSAEKISTDLQLSVYAYEVSSNEEWNKQVRKGIYRIEAFTDHSYTHLLLVDGDKKIFIDTYKESDVDVLKQVLTYFDESEYEYTDKEKLLYIEDILFILKENSTRIPWHD